MEKLVGLETYADARPFAREDLNDTHMIFFVIKEADLWKIYDSIWEEPFDEAHFLQEYTWDVTEQIYAVARAEQKIAYERLVPQHGYKKLVGLKTYAKTGPFAREEFIDNHLTYFAIKGADLRKIYESIWREPFDEERFRKEYTWDVTEQIYTAARAERKIVYERLIPRNGEDEPSVLEETAIDIALWIGGQTSDHELDSRELVCRIRQWAREFEAGVGAELDDDYMLAVEKFAQMKWEELKNGL